MEERKVLIRRSRQSVDLSLENLAFIFGNLQSPFEHGIYLYRTPNERNLFILDEWAAAEPSMYKPSEELLRLEKQLEESGHHYYGLFHNHNHIDIEDDVRNKLLILPSNIYIWNSNVQYMGLVRNFRGFSDLRIFLKDICTDYPYPPKYFITINTPVGNGTRIIKSCNWFSAEDEEKIEFEDTGYITDSVLLQAMT